MALRRTRVTAKQEFWRGVKACVPVTLGVIPCALVLGAQAAQKGMSPWLVACMTGLNFAGGSEFAAVELWSWPPHALLIVAVTLLINSRHLLMGAALSPYLSHLPKRRVLPALFVMCDESWALGHADAHTRRHLDLRHAFSMPYYLGTAVSLYVIWVPCTTLGAAMGPVLGDLNVYGFDMAFPAMFLVLLSGMWKGVRAALPWLASLGAACLSCIFLPGAWYVMLGAGTGLVTAWLLGEERTA